MLQTATVNELFQTAHHHHAQALELLDQGHLREAAAQAWAAALTATNALILSRTGQAPADLRETDRQIRQFALDNPALRPILTHYDILQEFLLHHNGMYDGFSVLAGGIAVDIRDAGNYLREVAELAAAPPSPGAPTVKELFHAAHNCHAQALEWLKKGHSRPAGRKAWDATCLATDGLILACTQEVVEEWQVYTVLTQLKRTEPELTGLVQLYSTLRGGLFADCLCDGICGPPEDMAEPVSDAHRYIKDAAKLAGEEPE